MSKVAAYPRAVSEAASEPVTVGGLFETHLTVSDIGRSVAFYRDVVGLPLALEVPERGAAFFWIAEPGEAMLGLWSLGSAPLGLSLHVAFKAQAAVAQSGTMRTTHLPHRLCRAAAGRSRSQPVRSLRKPW